MADARTGSSARRTRTRSSCRTWPVAVYGGTQPDRLARLLREGDDGLLARLLWLWPGPVPFRLGHFTPRAEWALGALDRLREPDLSPGGPPPASQGPLPPRR